jgi:hypothetical protein
VVQKAHIEVDEEGATATAATGIAVCCTYDFFTKPTLKDCQLEVHDLSYLVYYPPKLHTIMNANPLLKPALAMK